MGAIGDFFAWTFSGVFGILVFVLVIALFFLPTVIAILRRHRNALAIFLVNLLLGWTGIGWVVALIWSVIR